MVRFSSAARVLLTTAADFTLGGRVTGAGTLTLRDIRLVELQEQAKRVTARQIGVSFMRVG
jgi:hypothetical protein